MNEILEIRQKILNYVDEKLKIAPTENRKELAFWVKANCHKKLQGFVLAKSSGKEIEPLIHRYLPIKYIDFMEYKECFVDNP